jgi:hypothetical protein
MKTRKMTNMAIAFVSILFLAGANVSTAGQKPDDRTTQQKEVGQEVKEAVEAIKRYSADQRDEALNKVRIAIDDLDARIDELETRLENKWDQMDKTARSQARETLRSLREKRNDLAEWYGGMRHSSAKAWDHVKKGFLDSYESLRQTYNKAVEEF